MTPIQEAIFIIGLRQLAEHCGVSYQAVHKWKQQGRLPRTDYTGETNYAGVIEKLTNKRVTRKSLLQPRV